MRFGRLVRASACVLAVAVLAAGAVAPTALADGDPASDFLPQQDYYLPATPPPAKPSARALARLLEIARARHQPFKVAVIGSRIDLGAITSLWAHPQQYATFLSREIQTFLRGEGPLLVVMPAGFGVANAPTKQRLALASVHVPPNGTSTQLTNTAIEAVGAMARASGHPLPHVKIAAATSSSGGGGHAARWILIACLVVGLAGAVTLAMGLRARRALAREL